MKGLTRELRNLRMKSSSATARCVAIARRRGAWKGNQYGWDEAPTLRLTAPSRGDDSGKLRELAEIARLFKNGDITIEEAKRLAKMV